MLCARADPLHTITARNPRDGPPNLSPTTMLINLASCPRPFRPPAVPLSHCPTLAQTNLRVKQSLASQHGTSQAPAEAEARRQGGSHLGARPGQRWQNHNLEEALK